MAVSAMTSRSWCTCSGLLLLVPAELIAHRRQDLVGEVTEPARLKPLVQGCGDDRGGDALVDGGRARPPSLAGVGHPAFVVIQGRGLDEGGRDQVDEPGADHRAAAPDLGHLADVDLILVCLRSAQRSGLGVDLLLVQAGIGMLDNAQALADRGHHAVFDAVMYHFYEVTGPARTAVQVAMRRGTAGPVGLGQAPARRPLRPPPAPADGVEDRLPMLCVRIT